MAFDSLDILAALGLFTACIGAWLLAAPLRVAARLYLRFAAMLFAALGAAVPLGLADIAALFLLPLGAASLMVSALAQFARPLPAFAASLALVAALAGGLAALLSGMPLFALAPAMLAGLAVIAAALNSVAAVPVLAGASLLASGLVLLEQGARAGLFLFCAAALVGLAKPSAKQRPSSHQSPSSLPRRSALAVEQQRLTGAADAAVRGLR
ncbi:MAG TPA: hypothetical protein VNY75_11555 [Rhizomicrobium sp.]|nr:hypothetical protein [Rhizomicrobium sp.]